MKRCISIIILALLGLSCTHHSEHWQRLSSLEAIINERPDSVLSILQEIDPDCLSGDEERAKYALLLSMAYDKNYIDKTDDELISIAKEYYEDSNDVRNRFLSLYYYGRILYNRGDYTEAIVVYTSAEQELEKIGDDYLAGLLYTQFGEIYRHVYDHSKSLSAYQSAYNHYSAAGLEYHKAYALHDMGVAYGNLDEFGLAVENFDKALSLAHDLGDKYLEMICCQNLLMFYDITCEYEKCGDVAKYLTANFDEKEFSSKSLGSLACYYAAVKEYKRAEEYLNRAWERASDIVDTIDVAFKSANTMKLMGRKDDAMRYFEDGVQLQNRELQRALKQPVVSAQKEYFQTQAEFNEYRLNKNRQIFVTLAIIVILTVIVVAMYINHKITLKNREISRYMDTMQNLEQSLFTKDIAADRMIEQINHLFESQFSLIDKLSNTYYETHGTKRDKEAIYTQVRNEIEKLQTNKRYIQQLEDIVNRHKEGVMQLLRESMPEFSELDYRLLCFLYAGFSAKAISVFTGDSIGNIYMRKSRLKSKISASNAQNRELILRHLQ